MSSIIAFLTDFGSYDGYVGAMKGAVLKILPTATLVDITHEIGPQQILHGALVLENCYAFFPQGTVFVAVVDPGVGTRRKILAVKTRHYYFVAPDNGILDFVLRAEKIKEIVAIQNPRYFGTSSPSATFHGRDIMAPVAARLARGDRIFPRLGPSLKKYKHLAYPEVKKTASVLRGQVLYFDRFGNAITNIRSSDAPKSFWRQASVFLKGKKIKGICRTYGSEKGLISLFNSQGRLEIAVPQGSACELGQLREGEIVVVRKGA